MCLLMCFFPVDWILLDPGCALGIGSQTGLEGEESVDAVLTSPDKETEMSPDLEASNENTNEKQMKNVSNMIKACSKCSSDGKLFALF